MSDLLAAVNHGRTQSLQNALSSTPRSEIQGALGEHAIDVAARTGQKEAMTQLLRGGAEEYVTMRPRAEPKKKAEPTKNSFVRIAQHDAHQRKPKSQPDLLFEHNVFHQQCMGQY